MPNYSVLSTHSFFNPVSGGHSAVLRANLSAGLRGARSITLIRQHRAQFSRGRGRVVLRARECAARARPRDARAVVELVVAERDYERRDARAQALRGRPYPALMHDR